MKITLLEIVQDVLNDMDSFPVSSISDTVEAEQVAQIAKSTFYDLVSQRDLDFHRRTFQLNSGNSTRPTHCALPNKVKRLTVLKYNKRTSTDTRDKYEDVTYLYPDQFLSKLNERVSSDSNVDSITDPGGITLLIRNDSAPTYWTSFNDQTVVFDSYDSDVDSFIQNSKTQCIGFIEPSWSATDSAYPDLPEEMFSFYLNEVKSRAFYTLKQMTNEKAEQESNRQRRRMSQSAWQTKGGVRFDGYGRRSRK